MVCEPILLLSSGLDKLNRIFYGFFILFFLAMVSSHHHENKGMNGGSKHYLVETKDDGMKQDEMDEYWSKDFDKPSRRGWDRGQYVGLGDGIETDRGLKEEK